MNALRPRLSPAIVLAAVLCAGPVLASRPSDDLLTLVPPDAAAVAVVNWNELRGSALGAKLLSETDKMTVDGDAARFMAEARIDPREDIDAIVAAGSPAGGTETNGSVLVLFAGRFDTGRLADAMAARGGTKRSTPAGDYYLVPDKNEARRGRPGAVSFATARLVIAGDEASVAAALARHKSGGAASFESRAALGGSYSRISPDASAWALIDFQKFPAARRERLAASGQAGELIGAMKQVSVVALQATVRNDALDLAAAGLVDNAETRQLIEDSLRGVVAMWRLAVQDKNPEAVAMLRRFQVANDGKAVTIHGTLTGDYLRSIAEKRAQRF
jgi:hypothetical protein